MQHPPSESGNSQKEPLQLKLVSDKHPYSSTETEQKRLQPRRLRSYFMVLMEKGTITYNLDLQEFTLLEGQLLFAMPNQVFIPPAPHEDLKYFKVLFDETTLALLPQTFPFLVNPLNNQSLSFEAPVRARIKNVFEILHQLLQRKQHNSDSEILLAYLNLLLTEVNTAYFKNTASASLVNTNLSKFMEFKLVVETHLTEQPSVNAIANKLALSPNSLYRLVKEHSGVSPKDFFSQRLIIEAQRQLQYSKLSVKELAYELGFNDPDYFSRFFKKYTGKSVSEFLESLQDSSGS